MDKQQVANAVVEQARESCPEFEWSTDTPDSSIVSGKLLKGEEKLLELRFTYWNNVGPRLTLRDIYPLGREWGFKHIPEDRSIIQRQAASLLRDLKRKFQKKRDHFEEKRNQLEGILGEMDY